MKKKILVVMLIVLVSIFLVLLIKEREKVVEEKKSEITEFRGIFISYLEYFTYFNNKNDITVKKAIDTMIRNVKQKNFNSIILQVRPFSDAIYISDIYPCSYVITGKETNQCSFDILDYFVKQAGQNNIDIYAWINPYRIRNHTDITTISEKNPAYQYLNTNSIAITSKGIYYNPASREVIDLIKKGVKEIMDNYPVKGIIFDDYFYPDETIDLVSYEEYQVNGGLLSLEQFRYENVNTLVKEVHRLVNDHHRLFGISPEGNMENNYEKDYADIKTWLSSNDYVDFIMPQIYFGFNNETKPFYNTLMEWEALVVNDIDLLPALAA
jgi:uncharacterized lipoprotein YddW (UPF0748 family)